MSIQEKVCRSPKGFVRNGNERERERGGGGRGSGRGHERRARKRTGWKVHIESKTQVCWLTFLLAIDVHESALTPQDTSVSRIHLSSARLEKSDAWPASGHSFCISFSALINDFKRAMVLCKCKLLPAKQCGRVKSQDKIAGRLEPRRPPMKDEGTETAFRLDQCKHFRKSKHLLRSEVNRCDQSSVELHLRRSTSTGE